MVAYRTELIRKIIRLLEGDHDGEVASAARKLTSMAKEQGHNLDEMLSAVYGGNGSAKPYQRKSPAGNWEAAKAAQAEKKHHHGFDDDFVWPGWAGPDAARNDAARNDAKAKAERPAFRSAHLRHLSEYFDAFGCLPLTKWEGDFVVDILNRSDWRCIPTPRQLDTISAILTKYRNFKQRSGDEQAFWKA